MKTQTIAAPGGGIGMSPRAAGGIARLASGIAPRIMFAPNADGSATPEETAAAEKAAAEIAAKEAAEKAAKDAAEKAAEEELKKQQDGLDEKGKELLREVMDKKAKLRDAETAKKAAEDTNKQLMEKLKLFDGIDPVEVRKLLDDKKEAERKELEAKGEFDRVKQMIVDQHKVDMDAVRKQVSDKDAELSKRDKIIDELTIGSDFAGSTYIREDLLPSPAKVRQLYGAHFDTVDGKTVGYDKPAGETNRTPLTGADGKNLSFDAALKKIIEADPDKDTLLKSKMKPGGSSKTEAVQQKPTGAPREPGSLYGATRIAAGLKAT